MLVVKLFVDICEIVMFSLIKNIDLTIKQIGSITTKSRLFSFVLKYTENKHHLILYTGIYNVYQIC